MCSGRSAPSGRLRYGVGDDYASLTPAVDRRQQIARRQACVQARAQLARRKRPRRVPRRSCPPQVCHQFRQTLFQIISRIGWREWSRNVLDLSGSYTRIAIDHFLIHLSLRGQLIRYPPPVGGMTLTKA
jgi:hypothetical protein